MRNGFVLALTLYILLFVSLFATVKQTQTEILKQLHEEAHFIYRRLFAERQVFDEILFKRSLLVTENFDYYTDDYEYFVANDNDDITITVKGIEQYTIKLKYDDDCICFKEILYY